MDEKINRFGKEHPLAILESWYPQILLKIQPDMSQSKVYREVIHNIKAVPSDLLDRSFTYSAQDFLTLEEFSCGKVPVLYLDEREDFIKFIQKTAYQCEPVSVPVSMGAITISGLKRWDFRNYLIVLTKGFYSNLPFKRTGYTKAEWLKISYTIRKYHELTHFICRRKYKELKNPVLDEVTADCMGLFMATGNYDVKLAKSFLGIEEETYRYGMRLENYIQEHTDIESLAECIRSFIHKIEPLVLELKNKQVLFEENVDRLYLNAASMYKNITW